MSIFATSLAVTRRAIALVPNSAGRDSAPETMNEIAAAVRESVRGNSKVRTGN